MPSTGQATSPSASNSQLIINALADYTKITGIDLSKTPFAAELELSNSPQDNLQLLQKHEKAFEEKRDGTQGLVDCLGSTMNVLQAFSAKLGEVGGGLAPIPPVNAMFVGIDVLLATASAVSSSYDTLLELFKCLGSFLKRLEIYMTIPLTSMMMDMIVKVMVESLMVLALATKQLKDGRFKKFAKILLRESEIETVLQRLDRLTQDEARITVAQTLGVIYGLVGSVKAVMEGGNASMKNVRQDLVVLHQILNEMNKIKRDQLQREVQYWLSPPDPSTNQNFVWKARHKGTAAWFFEGDVLAKWKARGSLLWIHGKPGSGKSTLLSAIIQDIKGIHAAGLATMAYYYFDFRDVKKQDCYGLLSSLISQLAAESDPCYNILSHLYSDFSRGTRKPDIGKLKKCMTDMLSLPGKGPTYIIVDALDECPNLLGSRSALDEVLDLIKGVVDLKLSNVHLCVASRPEIEVRMVLEPLTPLKISLHDQAGQRKDINDYITSVVYSDRRMERWRGEDKRLVVDTLSEKANGMFSWVVCQFDRLRHTLPASIRKVLNDLPKTLDETYSHTLHGIEEEERESAQRLFRCLAVSIHPLRVEELAEVLAVRFPEAAPPTFNAAWRPENAEEAVLSACSGLVSIVDRGDRRVVQFSHFSVKEYLTSERLATEEERLSYYHILPEPAHTTLAHASLSVLLRLDDSINKNMIRYFPLAMYAARHWVGHAQFGNVSSRIQDSMERLFDPTKPHFATWVWLHDIDHHWTEPMPTIRPTLPEAVPLYYASLCGFRGLAERLLTAHSSDVNSMGGYHTTPLHAASVKGHLDVASLLLQNDADPNSRDHLRRAPLHRLSQGSHLVMPQSSLDIARLLLSSGAYVNVTNHEGRTPLHAAAQSGYLDLVRLLRKSGASLNIWNWDQETPLHLACHYGKLDIARFLIECGADVKSQDKNGHIPLQMASRFGHVDIARLLLDCGSDANVRDTQRWTPLHYASRYGHLYLAQLFIDRGADVNAQEEDRSTALHLASSNGHLDIVTLLIDRGANVDSWNDKQVTPLGLASSSGHLEVVRFLIESGAAVSVQDRKGHTPFHMASRQGHLHVTKLLLECGIDVDIRSGNEQTPLYLASMNGRLDVVRFLIEQGADILIGDSNNSNPLHIASLNGYLDVVQLMVNTGTYVDGRNGTQMTPLALASSAGKVEVGRFLIHRGADLNVRDDKSQALVHLATQDGHFDMARLLLDHGVDPDIKRNDLWTPLHLASANGHLKVAELLIQRGASVDTSNDKQETPLYQAVTNGDVAIARLLTDHGATVHTADSSGQTLLHAASRSGHLGVVKLLLRRGADVDVFNNAGKSAAELASENGQAEVAKFISEYKANANIRSKLRSTTLDTVDYGADDDKDEVETSLHAAAEEGNINTVKSLLDLGVDINARNESNQTPLGRVAAKGNVDVVRLLIERGAEIDSRDKWGCTPLHRSSRYGHLEVSRVLLDHGANVNARKRNYWTPMHLSTYNGHLEIVKLLLHSGADIHAMNDEGETPYQVSVRKVNREIADLLREHGAGRLGEWETMACCKAD